MKASFLPRVTRLLVITTTIVVATPAVAFSLRDDPSSGWGSDALSTRTFSGNVVTYHNLLAANITGDNLPALSLAMPFLWAMPPTLFGDISYLSLQWRNDLQAWYTPSYSDFLDLFNPPTTLTVTLSASSPPVSGFVPMAEIADMTGSQQLPLTQPCSGSPSCSSAPYPPETRNLLDSIPIISLGAFGPFEMKRFDLSFSYVFGDQRSRSLPVEAIAFTVSAVPLPAALWLFGSALAGFGMLRRRRRS